MERQKKEVQPGTLNLMVLIAVSNEYAGLRTAHSSEYRGKSLSTLGPLHGPVY